LVSIEAHRTNPVVHQTECVEESGTALGRLEHRTGSMGRRTTFPEKLFLGYSEAGVLDLSSGAPDRLTSSMIDFSNSYTNMVEVRWHAGLVQCFLLDMPCQNGSVLQ
jgi:hypothetical protein